MFSIQPRRPDSRTAYKELRKHAIILAGWCLAVRMAPYALDALQKHSK